MENPYGHDRWCNLMTAHSEEAGGGGRLWALGWVKRRGGWSGRMAWWGLEGLEGGMGIFSSEDWSAGVDLYSVPSDNQLWVKGIVLSPWTGSKLSFSVFHQWFGGERSFTIEIKPKFLEKHICSVRNVPQQMKKCVKLRRSVMCSNNIWTMFCVCVCARACTCVCVCVCLCGYPADLQFMGR